MTVGAADAEIGTATRSELDACAALVAEHASFDAYRITAQALASALREGVDRGERVFRARVGLALVGMAWVVPRGAFARSPYLRLLVVAPEASGTGIGSLLLEAVESWSFARDEHLFLLVNRVNTRARGFYARRGFVVVGQLHDYVGPGLDETIMRKRRPTATA